MRINALAGLWPVIQQTRPTFVAAAVSALVLLSCQTTPPVPTASPSTAHPSPTTVESAEQLSRPDLSFAVECAPPDGTGDAVTAADTLCLASPGGGRERITSPELAQLQGGACCVRWAPDGQRLAIRLTQSVDTQHDDVGIVMADGSGFVNLTNSPDEPSWGPTWSPDGTRIAFNWDHERPAGNLGFAMWMVRADGSDLRRITSVWSENPTWSPDGGVIGFGSNMCACNGLGGEAEFDIYTVHPDGSDLSQVTDWPGGEWIGGWSADGQRMAVGRHPDHFPGIWVLARDEAEISHLEPPSPSGVQLRGVQEWLPDGSFIMSGIAGLSPQFSPQALYLVPPDGQSAALLFSDSGGAALRPSGEGKAVATLSVDHRWLASGGGHALEIRGRLLVDGEAAGGRALEIGRLGATVPTEVLATVTSAPDGTFSTSLQLGEGPGWDDPEFASYWRFATVFWAGAATEWSTATFETLDRDQ